MKLLDEVAVTLPRWVRALFAFLAVDFTILSFWFAGMAEGGWGTVAGSVFSAIVAILLLVASTTGRIPRWTWFIPWIPSG